MQAVGQARAFDEAVVKQGFGFAIGCAFELRHRFGACAQGLQFFQQGRGGVATGIQAHGHGHEFLLHRFVSRQGRHCGDVRRQTTRRCVSRHGRISCGQPLRFELLKQDARESIAEFLQGFGGEFFYEEFDE